MIQLRGNKQISDFEIILIAIVRLSERLTASVSWQLHSRCFVPDNVILITVPEVRWLEPRVKLFFFFPLILQLSRQTVNLSLRRLSHSKLIKNAEKQKKIYIYYIRQNLSI